MYARRDWIFLTAMIVVAIALRLPLVSTGITIDDACSAYVVEAGNWGDFVNRIRTIEMSPPLYFMTLKATTTLFGLTTPVLALTSLVLSVLTVPVMYFLGAASTGSDTADEEKSAVGLCSAFFTTISMLAIIYSHEARTYALAGLLMASTLLVYMPFFDGRASLARRFGLFVLTVMLAYTHYTSVAYLGLMTITAFLYRKNGRSKSLLAIPSMVAGLATLLPWYPVLKYHSSVGTPWADKTPLNYYLTVLDSNASAAVPLPVVASYLILTLVVPTVIALLVVLKPQSMRQKTIALLHSPKPFTLALLFFYSASVFGFITPYIFGYVRYMYPIACTGWILLALLSVSLARAVGRVEKFKVLSDTGARRLVVASLAALSIGLSAWEVRGIAAEDRSGLRLLAKDIVAGKFKDAAYLTTPDFVGIILVYYLKHECGLSADKLPAILGFAYPEGGLLPPKHETRASAWQDPDLMKHYEGYIDDLHKKGADQVVLIRDTYSPNSKLIATGTLTDQLEKLLRSRYRQNGQTQMYRGHASSYLVTRFDFEPVK